MNFNQTLNDTHNKEWMSECGSYRIVWRDQVAGVSITPGYQAMINVLSREGRGYWSWVGRNSPYRTFKAAETACKKHQRDWQKFVKLTEAKGNRVSRVKELKETGKYKEVPAWVSQGVDEALVKMFYGR